MSDQILVPYDGSDQSADALSSALTAFPAGEIQLLHVVEPYTGGIEMPTDAVARHHEKRENAEEMLKTARNESDSPDRIETTTVVGRPVQQILAYTEANGIEHIVIGSHGRDGAARLLLGSVAETVVRRSPVPVTVVRHAQKRIERPDEVLVPFDGSIQSRGALTHALDRFGTATVTAVYVLYPSSHALTGTTGYGNLAGEIENWEQQRHDHAADILEITETVASDYDRDVQTKEIEGRPAEAIVEYVDDNDIDHVVIGSTGRDGIARLLLGSVAETVVRRSPVSVTVTK